MVNLLKLILVFYSKSKTDHGVLILIVKNEIELDPFFSDESALTGLGLPGCCCNQGLARFINVKGPRVVLGVKQMWTLWRHLKAKGKKIDFCELWVFHFVNFRVFFVGPDWARASCAQQIFGPLWVF